MTITRVTSDTPYIAARRCLEAACEKIFVQKGVDALLYYQPCAKRSGRNDFLLQTIEDESQLEEHLTCLEAGSLGDTILVLLQDHSWGRLRITRAAFDMLTMSMNVSPSFHEIISTFGMKTDDNERAFDGYRACTHSTICLRHQHDISYTIPYVQRHKRELKDPWSLRRLGVYHQTHADTNSSRWILVDLADHTKEDLKDFIGSKPARSKALFHAELLIYSSVSWGEYVEYLAEVIRNLDYKACYSTMKDNPETKYDVTQTDLQTVHMLEAKMLRASAAVETCREVARGVDKHVLTHSWLDKTSADDQEARNFLDTYHADMERHSLKLQRLILRLESTQNLMSNILSCRSGQLLQVSNLASNEMLEALLHMTDQSRQQQETLASILGQDRLDSAMLKALSIVATVCLPPSLVATVFSSNLIQSSDSPGPTPETHLVLSSQFWLYIVISIPMMAITMAWIIYLNHKSRRSNLKA